MDTWRSVLFASCYMVVVAKAVQCFGNLWFLLWLVLAPSLIPCNNWIGPPFVRLSKRMQQLTNELVELPRPLFREKGLNGSHSQHHCVPTILNNIEITQGTLQKTQPLRILLWWDRRVRSRTMSWEWRVTITFLTLWRHNNAWTIEWHVGFWGSGLCSIFFHIWW